MRVLILTTALIFTYIFSHAQMTNWYDQDAKPGKLMSISTDKVYSELIPNRKPQEVIVAILDSGVDAEHEDLKNRMWVNTDEIPNNGKDDDGNGYIDDIHGWNFLGNADGRNVHQDNLEITRIYGKYHKLFKDRTSVIGVPKDLIDEYQEYVDAKQVVESQREKHLAKFTELKKSKAYLHDIMDAVGMELGRDSIFDTDIDGFQQSPQQLLTVAGGFLKEIKAEYGVIPTVSQLKEDVNFQFDALMENPDLKGNYHFNPDLDTREIVGDDYNNKKERYYGNNDVEGPDAMHGTHVAGIVAAERDNEIGMNGVSANAKLMSVRVVPDGDERDKDVANAIIYAVDNGAKVINMSFGKGQSPYKGIVDKAVRYAEKNDVLLVHAAGNDSENIDVVGNFPNDMYKKPMGFLFFKKKSPKNWLEIGAVGSDEGDRSVAPFSNYGKTQVDVFAPGLYMISTLPDDNYTVLQGTSMAAPVVSGIAAVLRGYFPDLKAKDIKDIIIDSALKTSKEVVVPGSDNTKMKFSELSLSGGSVNLYTAFALANKKSKYGSDKMKTKNAAESNKVKSSAAKAVEAGS